MGTLVSTVCCQRCRVVVLLLSRTQCAFWCWFKFNLLCNYWGPSKPLNLVSLELIWSRQMWAWWQPFQVFFARICRDTLDECQQAQRLSPVGFESRTGWLKRWIPHLNGHFALLVCRFCVSFPWNLWHITQIDASHLTVSGFVLSKVIIYGCFTGVFSRAELCIHVVSHCPRCSIRIGWFCIARFTPWTIPMFSFSAGSSVPYMWRGEK